MIAQAMEDPRIQLQKELERLYDKNQLMPRVRQEFRDCKEFNFVEYLRSKEIPEDFGIDLLAQMAVRKRADPATLIGVLRHHCEDAQTVASLLERAAKADLVDYSVREQCFIVVFTISEDLQRELDRFQYPLPMVVPPRELKSNLSSGYLSGRSSVILRDNHHDEDVCLDHLNRLNRIKLSLNLNVARTIQNKWRNLDRKREDESWEEFSKRRKAFEKYDSVAKDVISLLVREGNEIYLTHKYDKRGRTYCMGYHITYQGTDWNKAVIEFADKEKLT